jgi:hypothetical protein
MAGSSSTPRNRSVISWVLALVVMLNSSPPVAAAAVMTRKARASWASFSDTLALVARLDGGSVSFGHSQANARHRPRHTRPGTAKAMRQPNHLTR